MPPKGTAHKAKKKPHHSRSRREVGMDEGVSIAPYEEGAEKGGVRAWNEAHEQLMRDFYDGKMARVTQFELNENLDKVRVPYSPADCLR
jgi:hypothetical protein